MQENIKLVLIIVLTALLSITSTLLFVEKNTLKNRQNNQNQDIVIEPAQPDQNAKEMVNLPKEPKDTRQDEKVVSPEVKNVVEMNTHKNRLFTIDYPKDWRVFTNEVGGLESLRQPTDDHLVVAVTYEDARYGDVTRCDLHTRSGWGSYSKTVVESAQGTQIIRYEGVNKLGQKDTAIVALAAGEAIHDCTILDFDFAWAVDKQTFETIIDSVKIAK